MKLLLLLISMTGISSAFAASSFTPPFSLNKFAEQPSCTVTESYTAQGSMTCNGNTTYYTVTNSCTATDADCSVAEVSARMCATITATRNLKKVMSFVSCDGPEPPQP